MDSILKRFIALSLTMLLFGQAALAASGGLLLCLPMGSGPFQVHLDCSDREVALCCGETSRETLDFVDSYEACKLCRDIKVDVEREDPWLTGERSSPKVPVFILVSDLGLSQVKALPTTVFAESCLSRAPPQVSDARQQFRDVVSLRL
ncbi:MAG: hypothetical protein GVY36_10145 [Verrucomicrobia bacterium]|jgi:hypothetical protein|nr:hypothetical protein [Verrucomicrobiota bacterium]